MNLTSLQNKEIIDISTGKRLGNIIDLYINEKGNIEKIELEDKKRKLFFKQDNNDNYILWNQIIKIGDDIILVKTN